MFTEGGQTRKHCFLVMFTEGGQTSKHCFLAMFTEGEQVAFLLEIYQTFPVTNYDVVLSEPQFVARSQ